ncbi:DNA-directed RNA polymerase II subunit 4 isoform X2 [Populus alba x Populus x berolinensis]|uniref:DNA-directed RNA polymerase II subunit 4 isoform X2 n=1 Tax=Populus alba x Populus x berolinensis TaxID=444605 RepID=A0AAD6QUN1_9ROSI|nr:DNA-directed RNA polymerase II subunit 4 isoform X2 [Populus alba x Populus x berolinensis]
MSGEEEENAAELKIGDDFLKAKCLMNCEVALILEHKYEQLQQMSDDPMNQVSQVFEKSLQYVKRFSRYKNPDAVRQVREILSRYQLAEFELCVLGNLCPETVEEAIAMVPSIKVGLFRHLVWPFYLRLLLIRSVYSDNEINSGDKQIN